MMQRTTVTADEADLETLRAEARRRGVSLSTVLAEVDYWCHERLTADAWLPFLDDVLAGVYRPNRPQIATSNAASTSRSSTTTSGSAWSTPA
jgi:hypothetical protein